MEPELKSGYNGTIRWSKPEQRWLSSCEICWDIQREVKFESGSPKQGLATMGLKMHIKKIHGVEPQVRVGTQIQ